MDGKGQTSFINGTCLAMCPVNEAIMRQREGLIQILECKVNQVGVRSNHADNRRMVKEFARPAAGKVIKPCSVRPLPILQRTVRYLLSEVCASEDVSWREKFEFISDRLRAIQQDICVQGLTGPKVALLLVPAVRFFVFAHYRLCEYETIEFDPHLNLKQLNQNLFTIIGIYKSHLDKIDSTMYHYDKSTNRYEIEYVQDDSDYEWGSTSPVTADAAHMQDNNFSNMSSMKQSGSSYLDTEAVSKQMETLTMKESSSPETSCPNSVLDQVAIKKYSIIEEMESLYLLVNLTNEEIITHTLSLPLELRSGQLLGKVLNACICWLSGNYYPLLQLAPSLPPILSCAFHLHLNKIQRYALGILSTAHNNPVLSYQSEDLQRNLLFDSTESLLKACLNYGLSTSSTGVKFSKAAFNWKAPTMKPQKANWIEAKLQENDLSSILLM